MSSCQPVTWHNCGNQLTTDWGTGHSTLSLCLSYLAIVLWITHTYTHNNNNTHWLNFIVFTLQPHFLLFTITNKKKGGVTREANKTWVLEHWGVCPRSWTGTWLRQDWSGDFCKCMAASFCPHLPEIPPTEMRANVRTRPAGKLQEQHCREGHHWELFGLKECAVGCWFHNVPAEMSSNCFPLVS